MNKRYRLGDIEEAVSEMEELIDIEDDIAEIDDTPKNIIVPLMGVGIIIITIFGFYLYGRNKDKW